MEKYKDILRDAIDSKRIDEIAEEWMEMICDFAEKIKKENPKEYDKLMDGLYVSVYGECFSEDMAKRAVSKMVNEDGTKGEHWSLEETTRVAKVNGIRFKLFNEYDWYYVMNMIYSDFYKVIGDNDDKYVEMAVAWLDDKDVESGKAYRYYRYVVC